MIPVSDYERSFGLKVTAWVVAIILSWGIAVLLYLYAPFPLGTDWLRYVASGITGVIVFVVLLILAYRFMVRYDASAVTESYSNGKSGRKVVRPCPVGPHPMRAGGSREFDLNVGAGDVVEGEICDVYERPFNWYLLDSANIESYRNGQSYSPVEHGMDEVSYKVRLAIPSDGFWSIVIDLSGREGEYNVLLDLEAVRAPNP